MNGFPEDEPWWSDDEPLIRKGSTRPAVIFAMCYAIAAAATFAALLLHLTGVL